MDINPDFPVVDGYYRITTEWSMQLPSKFNRRLEDGDLVLWQPGLTAWIAVWNNDNNETPDQRLFLIKKSQSPDARSPKEQRNKNIIHYSYRLYILVHLFLVVAYAWISFAFALLTSTVVSILLI